MRAGIALALAPMRAAIALALAPMRAALALAALALAPAALAAVALAAVASPARAATVSVDGSFVRIVAAAGEANQLAVAAAALDQGTPASSVATTARGQGTPTSSLAITDAGAPLAPGPGCSQEDVGVTCVTAGEPEIDVLAGDGDDSVTIAAPAGAFVDGGAGDDLIQLAPGVSDSVWCGRGRDSVTGEVRDFLDLACERVDYGAPSSAGRLHWLTGGGRWVSVPGQSWARVDVRILPDVLHLVRRYHVRIVEGYGTIGHEPFGEHPLGLAVDIVPGAGGSWDDVSRLARWAEPRQNHPRAPFRWVGWNGDFNHGHPSICKPRLGCAPHLHLSWSHTQTPPRHLARTVRVFEVRAGAP
jgi:hypothetical protein